MTSRPLTLAKIFEEHVGKVSDKWSIYITEYDRLFEAYRDRPVCLLEIGIQNGGSLEIWGKFFTNAHKLIGCDINPDCAQLQFDDPKIAVVVADANTDQTQQHLLNLSPEFDLIIDDGSHHSGDIVRSFARYFTYLNDGGLYIAEDLHCSYWQDFEGGLFQPYSSIAFFKQLADTINHEHWGVDKTRSELLRSFNRQYNTLLDEVSLAHIHSIEFINSMCVIRKAVPTDNVLGRRFVAGTNALVWEGALLLHGSSSPHPNQSENQWATKDAPVDELAGQLQKIASLNQAVSERDGEIQNINQAITEREQAHLAQLALARQQLETQLLELANREKAYSQQLQDIQQAHEQQKTEQGRQHAEREQAHLAQLALVRQQLEAQLLELAERERTYSQQLQDIQQAHEQQKTEQGRQHAEREQAHLAQLALVRQQLETQLLELAERERTYSQQLHDIQQAHEQQKTEQGRQHAEREQAHLAQLALARQKIETHLIELAAREKAFSEQLQEIHQRADAERTGLNQQHQVHLQEIQRQQAEHEWLTAERIHMLNQELHHLQADNATREQAHADIVDSLQKELTALLRMQAQREQETAAQLLAIQQQANTEKTELSRQHQAHLQEIKRQQAEHEWLTAERIHTLNQELHRLLADNATREQEIAAQLLAIQQQTEQQKAEQGRQHAEREQVLSQQLQAGQQELRHIEQARADMQRQFAEREQTLVAQISHSRHQIEAQLLELANREKAYAQQLQDIQQAHEQQKTEQNRQHAEREQALNAQLHAKQDELHNLTHRWTETEKAQAQGLAQLHIGLKAMHATLLPTPLNTNNRIFDMPLGHTSTAAATLEELFSYHDEHFIHSAYYTLLGRAPDPEGMRYYLARVRAGISKVEILAQLRLSAEGKSREVKIAGLNKAIHSHQRQKKSIFGALLRLVGVKADKAAQNLRAIENKFHMVNFKLQQQFSEMDKGFCRLEKLFQNQERTQELINKQIALSQKSQNVSLGSSGPAGGAIKVSVIILTKNPGPIFKDVLLAALSQETPWLYEVLVVDSGSTDGTIDFVQQHPRVRLLEVKSSEFGHGRTRNFAVSMAKGQYAAMLTHDAKPLNSNWLFNLVRPLDDDASVAGVFGRHKAYPDHTPYIKRDMELHFNGFLQWPAVMGIEDPERYAREQGYRQVLHYFSDNNACLRKEVWEKIPYPDVNFAEDQLWAKAIIEAGYKRAYANDAVVYHSHDYSIKDTFRRSFDESRALKSLFDYDLCPSASHGFTQIYACAKSDLKFLAGSTGLINSFGLALKTPLIHTAKQTGWYIGRYQGRIKGILFWLFSLDDAKKRKTNMTFTNKLKSLFSNKERDSNQHSITESTQPAAVVNKTDVIGFYDFVLTEDAGTLPADSDAFEDMSINWLIPDFGIGSGGHLNIFRFIEMLEKKGYKNTICIVGNHRYPSPFQARAIITEHFFALQADVVFGVENLPAARYSFATSWITAYTLKGFGATLHKLYFVQDFEPAFYSRGSEYDFAEETYKFGFIGVCAGSWLSSTLEANYGMRCYTISFSYDHDLYKQTPRREPNKQRVFCYCRPPTIRRGWESAMLALSLVGQKLPDVEFIFAGWDMGNYHFPYPHLNAGTCSLKELPDLFSQCDVALVLSFTNLSLLPLELMSCGCVVVSNRAPNTEWLLNDNNSILPESSSPRAIADAIENILVDTQRRVELANRAKVFASSTSWFVEGDKLVNILNGLEHEKFGVIASN